MSGKLYNIKDFKGRRKSALDIIREKGSSKSKALKKAKDKGHALKRHFEKFDMPQ